MVSRLNTASSGMEAAGPDCARKTISLVDVSCVVCGAADAATEASGRDFEYDTVPDRFSFVRCRRCGHVYLTPRPSAADLPVIYPANYYSFSEGGNPLVARLRRVWEAKKVRLYRS